MTTLFPPRPGRTAPPRARGIGGRSVRAAFLVAAAALFGAGVSVPPPAARAEGGGATSATAPDVLAIVPPGWEPALADWTKHRTAGGRRVRVHPLAEGEDPGAVVRAAAASGSLRFVLLVGDVDRIPCAYRPVEATRKWETETRIATDAPYADTDGDDVPDVALGRIPAANAAEATAMLARVLAYESDASSSDWRRRAAVIAGTGGFGPAQDLALETITRQYLVKNIPASVVVSATWGNPLSTWCPPPAEFADTVLARLAEGALLVAYIGHGHPRELDRVKTGREKHPILTMDHVERVEVRNGAPVAVFIACSTGRFDGAEDSLAEALLRRPRGPVAVIASSRVSTPYSNGILSKELLDAVWKSRAGTAGELLLTMKRRLAAAPDDDQRRQIEALAAQLYDPSDAARAADRREHQFLYNLLGDPTTVLQRPAELPLEAPATARPGERIVVRGTAAAAGDLVVELSRRRDTRVPPGPRKTAEEWRATYTAQNRQEIAAVARAVPAGPFSVEIEVPADAAPGPHQVRAHLGAGAASAAGGADLEIRPKPATPETPR